MLPKLQALIGTNNVLHDKTNGELVSAEFKMSGELIVQKTCVKYLGIIM